MMLVTLALSPASCAAMLPQKFSAATTANLPLPPPVEPPEEPGAAGEPERPQPATPTNRTAASAPDRAGRQMNTLEDSGGPFIAGSTDTRCDGPCLRAPSKR